MSRIVRSKMANRRALFPLTAGERTAALVIWLFVFLAPAASEDAVRTFEIPQHFSVFVPHDVEPGYTVGRLVRPAFVSAHCEGARLFSADIRTGDVTTRKSLAGHKDKSVSLSVYWADGSGETHFLYISIIDRQKLPSFPSDFHVGAVGENLPPGTMVGGLGTLRVHPQALGTPSPAAHNISYHLISDSHLPFSLGHHATKEEETVEIYTTEMLDRETRGKYDMTVTVSLGTDNKNSDSEVWAWGWNCVARALVHVTVADDNDNPPVFTNERYEAKTVATADRKPVVQVHAVDPDNGNNGTVVYSLSPPVSGFTIVPKTGQIWMTGAAHLGSQDRHKLVIHARDSGVPSLVSQPASVIVQVLKSGDESDGSVEKSRSKRRALPNIQVSMAENTEVSSPILDVNNQPSDPVNDQFTIIYPEPSRRRVTIDGATGVVRVGKLLDREEQEWENITVEITNPYRQTNRVNVNIQLTDLNDNSPRWTMVPFPYQAVVPVNAPRGTLVYQLTAEDNDLGENAEFQFFLESGGDGRFELDSATGDVTTSGLPFTANQEYIVHARARDTGRNDSPQAVVSIIAGNRPPQFMRQTYDVTVPEETRDQYPVVQVEAMSFRGSRISYSLKSSMDMFAINRLNGQITLHRGIDYETEQRQYTLSVEAMETGVNPMSSIVQVRVTVADINDCTPEFANPIYSQRDVVENIPSTKAILQVSAGDCDSDENQRISYSVDDDHFRIASDGTIYPSSQLDYEVPNNMYEFLVKAVDHGTPVLTGSATVRVRMANINDEPPVFSQKTYTTFVAEDAEPGGLVATVHATDMDGDGITYAITGGNDGTFVIDTKDGIIRLSDNPSLQGSHYTLNVTATDDNASGGPGSLTGTAVVVVGINDINNNKPDFTECAEYVPSVPEGQPSGTFVIQVTASDADQGSNGRVTYSIVHREDSETMFNIDADSGEISTAVVFDREERRDHAVTVTATDNADNPLIGVCQLIVHITDVNDNDPVFENNKYAAVLSENTALHTSFLRVAAQDADIGRNAEISYSLSEEMPKYLGIDNQTGWLYVKSAISQTQRIIRRVIATDGGGRSTSVRLDVAITDVENEPPMWEREYPAVTIPENTPIDQVVATVKASSSLLDSRITYSLVDGQLPETNKPKRFYLRTNRATRTADICVFHPLDFETTPRFELKIRAENAARIPLAAYTIVEIRLTDVNDEVPDFTAKSYAMSVAEQSPKGTSVGQVTAVDADTGDAGKVTYSISPDPDPLLRDWEKFRIDPSTGELFTKDMFDREKKSFYLLEVKAEDGAVSDRVELSNVNIPNSREAYVRISISDVNDNAPTFPRTQYQASVDEDKDVGYSVVTLTANDEDEGANAKLRYQITTGNVGGVFDVVPEIGTIVVAAPLDFEAVQEYELQLVASDGKNENTTKVNIKVNNINDEEPEFTRNEYTGSIREENNNTPIPILQVTARDPDRGASDADIRYSLQGQGANDEFSINIITGEIYASKSLDREERAVWRFIALATDEKGRGLVGFSDVAISLSDINDNAPKFNDGPYVGSVLENTAAGTSVMTVTAADADDPDVGRNAKLTYRIAKNAKQNRVDLFRIDRNTGKIFTTVGNLDRETIKEYTLVVRAEDGDGLWGTGTVTVQVGDINDNPPAFYQRIYSTMMSEGLGKDGIVTTVVATDADIGDNAPLFYSIVGGNKNNQFRMDNSDNKGIVRVNRRVDYEEPTQRKFNLTLEVRDLDFTSRGYCVIDVLDYNDNPPVFNPVYYEEEIYENATVGMLLRILAATDRDTGDNAVFKFSINPNSDPDEQFLIGAQNGILTVNKALDRETLPQHRLTIQATDMGPPSLVGNATFVVNLLDINDNGPVFKEDYRPAIPENTAGPLHVQLIEAVDYDSDPPNGRPFVYAVPDPNPLAREFDFKDNGDDTAVVTTKRSFDRETQELYEMLVIIWDSGQPQMSATNTLTVTIANENDNPHYGGTKEVTVYNFKGAMPDSPIGIVHAPDRDDGALVNPDVKTYVFESTEPKYFWLNESSGMAYIRENTPAGRHTFSVRVSDGIWADAVSSLVVNVKEVTEEQLVNSGSIRFDGATAEEFITPGKDGQSKYDLFRQAIAKVVGARVQNVDIFSVLNVPGRRSVDVRYTAHGSPVYPAHKLNGLAAQNRQTLEEMVGLPVAEVNVDPCVQEICRTGGCSSRLETSDTPTLVNSGSASFVSVTTTMVHECTCPQRAEVRGLCNSNPCYNGGKCINTPTGYKCKCRNGYNGIDCQQTKRSFKANGFAWFDPLPQCLDTRMSLEFITKHPDGLLLYTGPVAPLATGEPRDFMAVELVRGKPRLTINLGDGPLQLDIAVTTTLNDKKWHRLDIIRQGSTTRFMLDRCKNSVITETVGTGRGTSAEDRTGCEAIGRVPGKSRFLNVLSPLQLGGIAQKSLPYPTLTNYDFLGCIQNLVQDTKVIDLAKAQLSQNSEEGCTQTDANCQPDSITPICGPNGTCVGTWDSFYCTCHPGFNGDRCQQATPEYSFDSESWIRYQLRRPVSARDTQHQLMFRTRVPNGLLMAAASRDRQEFTSLELMNGKVQYRFNIGDGVHIVRLEDFTVDDGEWHVVNVERFGNEVSLKLDGGGGQREITIALGSHREILIDQNSVLVGANVSESAEGKNVYNDFIGCVNDIRLNEEYLPMEGENAVAMATTEGLQPGCWDHEECLSAPCVIPFVCVDLWRGYICRDDCESAPCLNGGICDVHAYGFICTCPVGWTGVACDQEDQTSARIVGAVGISIGAVVAILLCLLVLLVLVLACVMYKKQLKAATTKYLAVDGGHDDVRENIISYDDEGGGEEDQEVYDIRKLQRPDKESPTRSKRPLEPRIDVPPDDVPQLRPTLPQGDNPDVADFIGARLHDADNDPTAPPHDSIQPYDYEGQGSTAGSLSSLTSASSEDDQDYEYLDNWGPQFRNLADMYSGAPGGANP
ncbi:neural-cadherin-like [Branchiostoma lanceolatum]|uniref:neural-cadherin-like n=1 Tax=Branchiostoma lanceolatum TaxID=7740 RepID=UPI003456E460